MTEKSIPKKYKSIQIGDKFGKLVVIASAGKDNHGNKKWKCQCACGNVSTPLQFALFGGNAKSCGCVGKENRIKSVTTHGRSRTTLYKIWNGMKMRCQKPKNRNYKNYGGRGIKVCERWDKSFENFLADMGERPSRNHSIERVDGNGDYCPENCKWATRSEQNRNHRGNHLVTINGETKCLTDWCEQYNIKYDMVRTRINRRGWNPIDALTVPPIPQGQTYKS